eukprot:TRINITY_DN7324_c0_g1_i1.p2 TRINITY_DN7324_c0_g1~~TRINITY_DN7324_c0_g1_i1.p2  ORF type:complete len:182 (-),score=53.92 TRINITY_DN7324_c0_g1_i1:414-959(-)
MAIVSPSYVFGGPVELLLKEKIMSITGDGFEIKDPTGRPMFKVKPKLLTISQKKTLCDAMGNDLVEIRKKHLTLHNTQYLSRPGGEDLAEVKAASIIQLRQNGKVILNNGTVFEIAGDFLGKRYTITCGGRELANVNRDLVNFRNFLTDQDTYRLIIQPGVDCALMTAAVICLDEIFHDKN